MSDEQDVSEFKVGAFGDNLAAIGQAAQAVIALTASVQATLNELTTGTAGVQVTTPYGAFVVKIVH